MNATASACAALSAHGFDAAALSVGLRLLMKVKGTASEARLESVLLGWEPARALFVRLPLDGIVSARLSEGELVEIRLFNGREAVLLEASIERIHRSPLDYMVVSFPEKAFTTPMKVPERVAVNLPARLRIEDAGGDVDVRLRDLCLRGTLLELSGPPLGRVGDRVRLTLDPVWANVASGAASVQATIKHLRAPHDGEHGGRPWMMGVVFDTLEAGMARTIEAAMTMARGSA